MIAQLAWRELHQQLAGRVFWIVFAVSALMVAGAMAIDELRVGLPEVGKRTGASAIMQTHVVWSLFFLFTAAALVGEAVLRDDMHGFADLARATPASPARYALGRFIGACGAVLLCFTSVPVAMAMSAAALGLGTGPVATYLFSFVVLALPNLVLASALSFVLASLTRSMTGCLLGAAGLLTLYGLAREGQSVGILEPFGFAAIAAATRGWEPVQRDANLPALVGVLLANRVLWLSITVPLIGSGTWLASRDRRLSSKRRSAPMSTIYSSLVSLRPVRISGPPHPQSGWKIIAAQLLVRTSFEARRTVLTPAFAALLGMGLAAATGAALKVEGQPATIAALARSFQLVPVVVILFFTGELFWGEREHNVAPIFAATPARGAVLVVSKLLAIAVVLLSLAAASAVAGAATEFGLGVSPDFGSYVGWYILPRVFDWLLLAALALFLQSLAPNKLAGWGYMVFYLIGSLALNKLGWQDPHYRYGAYPRAPLPPGLSGAHHVGWYQLGWATVAAAMVAVACWRGPPQAPAGKPHSVPKTGARPF